MGGNFNIKWTTQTSWPKELQAPLTMNMMERTEHETVWNKIVADSIPLSFVMDAKLKLAPDFVDRMHYVLYELNRLKLAYDIVCVHYIHLLPPKKVLQGLTISIPSMIHNVRSYLITLTGARKLQQYKFKKSVESELLQIPNLNVLTVHLNSQAFTQP